MTKKRHMYRSRDRMLRRLRKMGFGMQDVYAIQKRWGIDPMEMSKPKKVKVGMIVRD